MLARFLACISMLFFVQSVSAELDPYVQKMFKGYPFILETLKQASLQISAEERVKQLKKAAPRGLFNKHEILYSDLVVEFSHKREENNVYISSQSNKTVHSVKMVLAHYGTEHPEIVDAIKNRANNEGNWVVQDVKWRKSSGYLPLVRAFNLIDGQSLDIGIRWDRALHITYLVNHPVPGAYQNSFGSFKHSLQKEEPMDETGQTNLEDGVCLQGCNDPNGVQTLKIGDHHIYRGSVKDGKPHDLANGKLRRLYYRQEFTAADDFESYPFLTEYKYPAVFREGVAFRSTERRIYPAFKEFTYELENPTPGNERGFIVIPFDKDLSGDSVKIYSKVSCENKDAIYEGGINGSLKADGEGVELRVASNQYVLVETHFKNGKYGVFKATGEGENYLPQGNRLNIRVGDQLLLENIVWVRFEQNYISYGSPKATVTHLDPDTRLPTFRTIGPVYNTVYRGKHRYELFADGEWVKQEDAVYHTCWPAHVSGANPYGYMTIGYLEEMAKNPIGTYECIGSTITSTSSYDELVEEGTLRPQKINSKDRVNTLLTKSMMGQWYIKNTSDKAVFVYGYTYNPNGKNYVRANSLLWPGDVILLYSIDDDGDTIVLSFTCAQCTASQPASLELAIKR